MFSPFNIFKLYKVYEQLRTNYKNYLIKDDYLKLKNIVYSINHFFRKKRISIPDYKILNVNIKSLVIEELNNHHSSFFSSVESQLNYFFIQNLKKNKINIKLSIDWFENQIIDRGWNYGMNIHYPNTRNIGYRGLVPGKLYLSQMYPTINEYENKMLPTEIVVLGKKFKFEANKFLKKNIIKIGPAFRFKYLWDKKFQKNNISNKNILVALPISYEDSISILKLIDKISIIKYFNFNYLVKLHPTMNKKILLEKCKFHPNENIYFIKDQVNNYFNSSFVMISGMTSVSLEAIIYNLPVIVVMSTFNLNLNTIPNAVNKKLWKLCYDLNDLKESIKFYKNIKLAKQITINSKNILNDYFTKPTKKEIKKFIK